MRKFGSTQHQEYRIHAPSAHTIHKPNTAPHKRFFSNETIWAATRKAKNWAFVHHIKTNGYPKWSEDQ